MNILDELRRVMILVGDINAEDKAEREDKAYNMLLPIIDELRNNTAARKFGVVPGVMLSAELANEIKGMSLIDAIKHVRSRTNLGLKESNDLVINHRNNTRGK